MKHFIFYGLTMLIFLSFSNYPQQPFSTIELEHPEIYIGKENLITIKNYGVFQDAIKVTCYDGKISRIDKNTYRVKPTNLYQCKVVVEAGDRILAEKQFIPKTLPFPRLYVGATFDNKIDFTPKELRDANGLSLPYINTDINASAKVDRYTITRISKTGGHTLVINEGASFKKEASKLVQQAEQGDTYIFHNISFYWAEQFKEDHWASKVIYIK